MLSPLPPLLPPPGLAGAAYFAYGPTPPSALGVQSGRGPLAGTPYWAQAWQKVRHEREEHSPFLRPECASDSGVEKAEWPAPFGVGLRPISAPWRVLARGGLRNSPEGSPSQFRAPFSYREEEETEGEIEALAVQTSARPDDFFGLHDVQRSDDCDRRPSEGGSGPTSRQHGPLREGLRRPGLRQGAPPADAAAAEDARAVAEGTPVGAGRRGAGSRAAGVRQEPSGLPAATPGDVDPRGRAVRHALALMGWGARPLSERE